MDDSRRGRRVRGGSGRVGSGTGPQPFHHSHRAADGLRPSQLRGKGRVNAPLDPWLSGHSVSYYYFGYVMHGLLAKGSGVEPAVAYNLALALLFSLAFTGASGLVAEMVAMHRKGQGNRDVTPIGFGLLGGLLMVWVSNLQGIAEVGALLGALGSDGFWGWVGVEGATTVPESSSFFPTEFWWWWRSTRVIDAADSFPRHYGVPQLQLHPRRPAPPRHVAALRHPRPCLGVDVPSRPRDFFGVQWIRNNKVPFIVIALSLGGLGFLNSWDLPLGLALFLATTFIASRRSVATWSREHTKDWADIRGISRGSLSRALPTLLPWGPTLASIPLGPSRKGYSHPVTSITSWYSDSSYWLPCPSC